MDEKPRLLTPAEMGRPFAVTVSIDGAAVTLEADSIEHLLALRKAWEASKDDKPDPPHVVGG